MRPREEQRVFDAPILGFRTQIAIAKQILARFPPLVDSLKETADADPFIIALAMSP